MKLQSQLKEITNIVTKTMDDVKKLIIYLICKLLERNETLEKMMEKSKDISNLSLNFYKKSKKANSRCCILI